MSARDETATPATPAASSGTEAGSPLVARLAPEGEDEGVGFPPSPFRGRDPKTGGFVRRTREKRIGDLAKLGEEDLVGLLGRGLLEAVLSRPDFREAMNKIAERLLSLAAGGDFRAIEFLARLGGVANRDAKRTTGGAAAQTNIQVVITDPTKRKKR